MSKPRRIIIEMYQGKKTKTRTCSRTLLADAGPLPHICRTGAPAHEVSFRTKVGSRLKRQPTQHLDHAVDPEVGNRGWPQSVRYPASRFPFEDQALLPNSISVHDPFHTKKTHAHTHTHKTQMTQRLCSERGRPQRGC